MELLQAGWLWGILGVALPVIIHFWYQKKAQPIAWAASRWLTEKATLQHRGLRLHDILLLLVRCLLIILLSLMLAQPILHFFQKQKSRQVVHLVEPDAMLVSSFRFELENALKNGEKVVWIGLEAGKVENLTMVPPVQNSLLFLQKTINRAVTAQDSVKLYLSADQSIYDLPKIILEVPFQVLIAAKKQDNASTDLANLFKEKRLSPSILLHYQNTNERETVQAALGAFEDVYNVPMQTDVQPVSGKHYDVVLTDKLPARIDPATQYVVSGRGTWSDLPENVVLADSLRFATSELVKTGRLPEWLGELFVGHYQLDARKVRLSDEQIRGHFERVSTSRMEEADTFRRWLLAPFLLLIILERWLALRKNAPAYA